MYRCSVLFITFVTTTIASNHFTAASGYPIQSYNVYEDRYYPKAVFEGGQIQEYHGRPFIKAGGEAAGLIGSGNIGYGVGNIGYGTGVQQFGAGQDIGIGGNKGIEAATSVIRQIGAEGIGYRTDGIHIGDGGLGLSGRQGVGGDLGVGRGLGIGRSLGAGGGFRGGEAAIYPIGGHHGGYLDKKVFSDENKHIGGQTFEDNRRSNGVIGHHNAEGFKQEQLAGKNIKEDSSFFNNQHGGKRIVDDGKSYNGGQQFSEAGGNGQEENQKANHRKGHSNKGFKLSHHKDESKQEETFYDEANDEGDNLNFGGNQRHFGTNGQSNFKGGHENGQFANDELSKQGKYRQEHIVNNANADKGQYGQKTYHGNDEAYRVNNGAGQKSLLEKQEARVYLDHHHPHGYIPIHSDY